MGDIIAKAMSKSNLDKILTLSNTTVNIESYPMIYPEVNDTARIQRAHDAIVTSGKRGTLVFKAGQSYTISTKLTFNLSFVSILGYGAQINASAISSGEAINITGTQYPPFYQSTNFIMGLRLFGAGKSTNTIGIKFQGTNLAPQGIAPNASSHLAFYNLNIEKFGKGLYFGSHAYLLSFYSCDIFSCGTCVYSPDGTLYSDTDYGENITFNHCTLYSSDLGFDISNDAGSYYFRDCSIDYNSKMGTVGGSSLVVIDGGHIEHRYQGLTQPLFEIKSFGNLTLKNLLFYILDDGYSGTDLPYLFDHSTAQATSQLVVRDVWFRNIRTTTNRLCNGRIEISGTNTQFSGYLQSSDAMNIMPNGGDYESDLNVGTIHNVFIDDSGTVTNLTNTSNVDITVDSIGANGSVKSLKLNKKTTFSAKVNVFVRPKKGSKIAFELLYKKVGAGTGTPTIRTRFANMKQKIIQDASSNYLLNNVISDTGFIEAFPLTFTSAEVDWTKIKSTTTNQMPSVYDYFVIEFDLASFAGVINIDKIVITEM